MSKRARKSAQIKVFGIRSPVNVDSQLMEIILIRMMTSNANGLQVMERKPLHCQLLRS